MSAGVPKGTFPEFLTRTDKHGNFTNALWTQAALVVALILIPLMGPNSIDYFFELIADLSGLSLTVPYIVLAAAYLVFRLKQGSGPFTMLKSNVLAVTVASITAVVGVAGFFGAGIDYYFDKETGVEPIGAIVRTYGTPLILIALGFGLSAVNRLRAGTSPRTSKE